MMIADKIYKLLTNKPKAFLINEGGCCNDELKIVESMNMDVDEFSTSKQLLYELQVKKNNKYKVGIIHQNGNKYPSQVLSNFIKLIDPTIKLIIYKTNTELKSGIDNLV